MNIWHKLNSVVSSPGDSRSGTVQVGRIVQKKLRHGRMHRQLSARTPCVVVPPLAFFSDCLGVPENMGN